ncbi:MAG: carboxypeptidase-like regulatory domain-containing protein, partial [Acidobacteriota bacterium]
MRKALALTALLLCFTLSANVFSQTNASLSGTITDSSDAVLPGVTITVTNSKTGVVTTGLSNNAGAYSFPSLMAGVYTVTAELESFQKQIFTDVELQASGQRRLNFTLEVAAIATQVEVTTSAKEIVLESSSSVGDVLSEETMEELPQVNRNALDLVKVMSGVVLTDNTI